MSLVSMVLLGLGLCACPKRIPELGPGREDEEVLECGAPLEGLAAFRRWSIDVLGACAISSEGCDLSRRICAIAARKPERDDLRRRCAAAQDDCAQLQRACEPQR